MAEIEMTRSFLKLFRIQEAVLLLVMAVLACLPLALNNLLRDADLSLLLPITLLGAIMAWGLGVSNAKRISAGIILAGLGPLALITRIGGMWDSVFEALKGSFALFFALFKLIYFRQPIDMPPSLFLAREELIQKSLGLGSRFMVWFSGFLQGNPIEDFVIRTLVWCLLLWLVAAWAGWQLGRKNRLLTGIFPTTLVLAFVIDYTAKEIEILWLHLGLLLFLLGLMSFAEQKKHWELSKTDYAESTSLDTLVMVAVFAVTLTAFSSFASSVSIKDIIDKMREKRVQTTSEVQSEALGFDPVQNNANITGVANGLPRSHLITAGPDLSQQLVMVITTGELPPVPEAAHLPVPRHYWRTLTYQVYSGAGWRNPSAFGGDVEANEKLVTETPPAYRMLKQSVTFSSEAGERLYWAGTLVSANVPFKAAWLRKSTGSPLLYSNMLAALSSAKSYQAESLVLNVDAAALRASPGEYPDWVQSRFLSLPESVPARVYGLARELTASESTPYDRALAIERHLRTFPYTLEVGAPPAGRDAADYFLFDLQKGYCDYYATSMVVLARAADLPARLVIGYANGAYDFEHAQYVVTENYAHSWVEIYFTNIGWVEFEPTASMPVISYEEEKESAAPVVEARTNEESFVEHIASSLKKVFNAAGFPLLILLILGLLWIGYDAFRIAQLDPSQTVQLLYARFRRLARPVTGYAPKSQTVHAYAFALTQRMSSFKISPRFQNWFAPAQHEIGQLTELFSRSLFAPQHPSRAEADDALRNWSRLRWRLLLANVLAMQKGRIRPGG